MRVSKNTVLLILSMVNMMRVLRFISTKTHSNNHILYYEEEEDEEEDFFHVSQKANNCFQSSY